VKTEDYFKMMFEDTTRYFLPRRTYTIIRLDGKAFHTFTRNMQKPFDQILCNVMDETMLRLCEEIQGCQFGYTQSDEISLLLTDFEKETTDAWFGGNLQKIVSVSASMATAFFNVEMDDTPDFAFFDSRAFTISGREDVMDYFIWRQDDCMRNSIAGLAQSLYSHKELNKKNSNEQQEMIFAKGINWNDRPGREKRGCFAYKQRVLKFTPEGQEFFRESWFNTPAHDFRKSNILPNSVPEMPEKTMG